MEADLGAKRDQDHVGECRQDGEGCEPRTPVRQGRCPGHVRLPDLIDVRRKPSIGNPEFDLRNLVRRGGGACAAVAFRYS
ncbi:hypothetical protein Ait01nite_041230 [Actinoplanes italicus]|nr:hypothetical protein Ait01nite_041230 [Actinoplanes italicus]